MPIAWIKSRLSTRIPNRENTWEWLTKEVYPILRDCIAVVDNNASQLARGLYKVRTQLNDVEDYLAKKIQVVSPLSVLEVEDPVTHVKSLRLSVTTTSTSPSGTVDDGTIRVTPLDTKEYAQDKFFGVSPIHTTVFDKGNGAKAIQISIDPSVTDPTAGGVLYPAELATPNTPVTTYEPTVASYPDQVVTLSYGDDIFDRHQRNTSGVAITAMTLPSDPTLYLVGLKLEVLYSFYGPDGGNFYVTIDSLGKTFNGHNHWSFYIPSKTEIDAHGGYGANIGTSGTSEDRSSSSQLRAECIGQKISLSVDSDSYLDELTAGMFRLTASFERRSITNMQRYDYSYLLAQTGNPVVIGMTGATVPLDTWQAESGVTHYAISTDTGRALVGLSVCVDVPWNTSVAGDEVFMEIYDSVGNLIVPETNLTTAKENQTYSTGLLDVNFQSSYLSLRIRCSSAELYQLLNGMISLEYHFKDVSSVAPTITGHELLTGAQLSSEPVNQEDALISGNLSAPGEISLGQQFFTLAGTPGVTSIPAGTFTFKALGYVNGSSVGVTNSFRAKMMVWRNGQAAPDAPFLTATSGNVANTTPQVIDWTATLAAPVTITALDLIGVDYFAVTDGYDLRAFTIVYNEITRQTYITTTIPAMAGTGLIAHKSTTGRDEDNSHPESAMSQNVGTGTVSSGVLTVPTGYRACIASGNDHLHGMVGNGTVRLFFASSRKVLHGQTVATGYPFWLPTFGTGANLDLEITEAMSSAVFQLVMSSPVNSGNPCWILVSSMNY